MARARSSARILIVEDHRGLLLGLQETLRPEGYTLFAVTSGHEAITWLTYHQADLMLLDLKLPDIESCELVTRLGELNCSIPFIVMTGRGEEPVATDLLKRGALDYLVKDMDFLLVVPEVVRHALSSLRNKQVLARAELALAESESRFRSTADQAPVLIWMSGTDKQCTWFNRSWLEFTGRLMEQELGHQWIQSIHPDDRHRRLRAYIAAFRSRTPFSIEYRLRRHDGEWRWVLDRGVPLHEPDGEFTGYIGCCVDITERRWLERQVLQISESEQRRIGQDIHDGLGQKLVAIKLSTESLKRELGAHHPELQAQAAQICQLLRETIRQARSFSHELSAFTVQTGGLLTALEELARVSSLPGRIKCRLVCSSPVEPQDVEVATHLYRIAQEAVNNALKHSRASKVAISLAGQNGLLTLQITDNGRGFSGTLNPGDGLGLHLMKHRASLIGADLQLHSNPRSGVTVTCVLKGGS